jgi:hypothetical protein
LPDLVPPLLANWFARDPLLVLCIIACICAVIHGAFNPDRQGGGGLFSDEGTAAATDRVRGCFGYLRHSAHQLERPHHHNDT